MYLAGIDCDPGAVQDGNVRFLLTGDSSLSVEFGNEISEPVNGRVRAFGAALEKAGIAGITELVPTYRSLMVHYDPLILSYGEIRQKLQELLGTMDPAPLPPGPVLEIPVLYGGEAGPDLPFVAAWAGLSEEEVIRIHSSADYLIYMLGFTPGFAYLGGMCESIAAPRLTEPRLLIPAGSVGIAGTQTGIYPMASPGGWRLIGRTPLKIYDPDWERPILFQAGSYIRFVPVTKKEYDDILREAEAGTYIVKTHGKEGLPS